MEFLVKKGINVNDFVRIREELKWNHIPANLVGRAINGSMINISVFDNNTCIGIGITGCAMTIVLPVNTADQRIRSGRSRKEREQESLKNVKSV